MLTVPETAVSVQEFHSNNDVGYTSSNRPANINNSSFPRANDFHDDVSLSILIDSRLPNDKDNGAFVSSLSVQAVAHTNNQTINYQQKDQQLLKTNKGSFYSDAVLNIPNFINVCAGDGVRTIAISGRTLDSNNSSRLINNEPFSPDPNMSHDDFPAMNIASEKGNTDVITSDEQAIGKEHGDNDPDIVNLCAGNKDGSLAKVLGIVDFTSSGRCNFKELRIADHSAPVSPSFMSSSSSIMRQVQPVSPIMRQVQPVSPINDARDLAELDKDDIEQSKSKDSDCDRLECRKLFDPG